MHGLASSLGAQAFNFDTLSFKLIIIIIPVQKPREV